MNVRTGTVDERKAFKGEKKRCLEEKGGCEVEHLV